MEANSLYPTGGVWSNDAIIKLLGISKKNNWIVISDETYEEIVYDNEFTAIDKLNNIGTEVLTIRSMSKTYAMTGWRIGYAVGNAPSSHCIGFGHTSDC